jgi:DNA replication and repair protein RecF
MHLSHLSLSNFRAFARLDVELPGQVLVLFGANAQGKTTFLEAIYFLATFTSFHASSDRQLVNFNAATENLAVGRIVATYQRGETSHRMEVRLIHENTGNGSTRLRKEILLDGVKRSANEVIGHFTAVIFLPQMTRIIENSPEDRRRYLNLALSQAVPGYAQYLSDYQQSLTQRNALLKQLAERGGDADQLTYWDDQLSLTGSQIIFQRIRATQELEKLATRIHHRLTNSQEVLRFNYQPAYDPLPQPEGQYALIQRLPAERSRFSLEDIRQGFLQRLLTLRSEEIARGMTTIGPHRDELRFISNGIDLGDFGSRGQVRTALLSLKMAEVAWLKEKTGQSPILLLDETLAELDIQRRADLQVYLNDCEQAILTTTDLNLFTPDFVKNSVIWKVDSGFVASL